MTASTPFLSVIIPSYNEQRNIQRNVLTEVFSYLRTKKFHWEIILSDDGSTDGTVDTLRSFAKEVNAEFQGCCLVLANIHAGKGPTVQTGMLAAHGKWRLFTDFDQSTPLPEVEELLQVAEKGVPIVIGSREINGAKREKEPLHRHLMGRGFNLLTQILAVPGIFDTQCGFKLFSAEAAETLFSRLSVYGKQDQLPHAFTGAFDVEILFLARKYGFKIKEIPIHWQHNETDRVSPIKDSLRMLRDILRVRIADLQGKYPRKGA